MILLAILLVSLWPQSESTLRECIPSDINPQACLCNSTQCHDVAPINWCPIDGQLHLYTTSAEGERLQHSRADFNLPWLNPGADFTVKISPCKTYQKIIGFGGAMTDATALMVSCLSEGAKKNLMNSYFDCEKGIGYDFLRVPIGGSDYSEYFYTYDDTKDPDPNFEHFALNELDIKYKIPLIKLAKEISCRNIRLKGATWNAPSWMTTPRLENLTQFFIDHTEPDFYPLILAGMTPELNTIPKNCLKPEYYGEWARYHIKAIQAYKSLGLDFDFVTGGNEIQLLNCWEVDTYREFMVNHFCPELKKSGLDFKLLALDDQTPFMPKFLRILDDPAARSCIDGIATHAYLDFLPEISNPIMENFCEKYPDKVLFNSEFCICKYEYNYYETDDWGKAERYALEIINKMHSCSQGYLDWNLALNSEGGPNYVFNYCHAPIEVDCSKDEFYIKFAFYIMGHFSKFVPEGSIRIDATVEPSPNTKTANLQPLNAVAFKVKSPLCLKENVVAVVLNTNDIDVTTNLCVGKAKCAAINVPKKSIISTVALEPWYFTC